MKRVIRLSPFAFVWLMLFITAMTAQGQRSGVYLSFSDFQKDSLSYGIDCRKEKHRIRLEDFLNRRFITVLHRDEKLRLEKAVIYGVLYCDGSLQRFSGKQHYRLEEQGIVWIFSQDFTVSHGRGGGHREKRFFFSKGGNGSIQLLSLLNLKNAFPDRHDLHDELDLRFPSQQDLAAFDNYHNQYKVNHLLQKYFQ